MSQKESDTSTKPEEDIKELIFKKFQEQEYDAVYRLIKHGKFTNTEDLLKLWDEAHYKQKEKLLKKPLTTLMRFRVRKRNPPPESICPGGTRPKRHLPKHAIERLKFWLHQHRSNPYPNKLEKQMLADETGVTYNQVKTWFSNSRRLLQQRCTRSEEGEGQRHWDAGNCLDEKDKQCPCEDNHGSRAVENCLTAKRNITIMMESDSYADSDGSVQRENISRDTKIKLPSKDSMFSCTPKDHDASATCSWTGECTSEPSSFVRKENIHIGLEDKTNDSTEDCDNVPNDTNLNPANNIKENDNWDNRPLTKTPQTYTEHMINGHQNSSELGTYPELEHAPCFSPKEKKECISYQRISLSPLHTDDEICTSSRSSHFSSQDNRHKWMSSPANSLSFGSPSISIAKKKNTDLVPNSNFLRTCILRDQAPVVLQNATSLQQNYSQFGTEYGAYYLRSNHETSEPDILCKERKLHVSGDSGYQTDGNGGHGHRVDSITEDNGTHVSLSGEDETWDSLSSTGDEFSEFDDDDDDVDDVCYTTEPSYRPNYLQTESEGISECSQGNNSDYFPYQNGSSYTHSFFSNAANGYHSTAIYANEARFDGHWRRWANRMQPQNSDLNGIANSSKDNNSGSKDDNSGSRFNLVGRSEMMYYGMVRQNLAFLPGSLKSEQIDVRQGEDYKMENRNYNRNPSQNCNKFISGTFSQNQLPFSQEGFPISANSSVTYIGSAQYATRNYCMLCGTVTSQVPCWCVLWYQRQQYLDATTNMLCARKIDTSVVKQECFNQDESSHQVHQSRTGNSSNQINLSETENGSNQIHHSWSENRNNHVPVHLSWGENGSFHVHQSGTEHGNYQVHPTGTENDSKPARSSLYRNSANHIMGQFGGPHLQMAPHPNANLSGMYASASSASRNEDNIQPVFLSNSYSQPTQQQVWWPFLPNVYNPMLTETRRSNYCFPMFTNTANFTNRLVQPSSRPTLGPLASGYRTQDFAYGATVPMILPSSGQQTVAQALLDRARFHPGEQF